MIDKATSKPVLREKRFELSRESFLRERLLNLKKTFEKLVTDYPQVACLSIFGSTLRPNVREDSDIDAYLLVEEIDPNKLETVGNKFKEDLIKTGLTEEQVKGIKVRPIDRDLISRSIIENSDYFIDKAEVKRKIDSGEYGMTHPELPTIDSGLVRIFHLSVGEKVKLYRNYVIDELLQLGEAGEDIWSRIIDYIEFSESSRENVKIASLPRSLEVARKKYYTETI